MGWSHLKGVNTQNSSAFPTTYLCAFFGEQFYVRAICTTASTYSSPKMCTPLQCRHTHTHTHIGWIKQIRGVCHGWQWSREPVSALPEARWKYIRCTFKVHSEILLSLTVTPHDSSHLSGSTFFLSHTQTPMHTKYRLSFSLTHTYLLLKVEFHTSHRGIHCVSCTFFVLLTGDAPACRNSF